MQEPVSIGGDFTPIRVIYGNEIYVVLVGKDANIVERIAVTTLAKRYICAVGYDGRWASPPLPYAPGAEVKIVMAYTTGQRREFVTALPGPDKIGEPIVGPDWTTFAPTQ